jgi:hypothetical protein
MSEANGKLPRSLLAAIAIRTAPWIYMAMASALLTFAVLCLMDATGIGRSTTLVYGLLLVALVANNVYGTVFAWPRIMVLPSQSAGQEWFWFRVRMSVSLAVGLTLYSAAIVTTRIVGSNAARSAMTTPGVTLEKGASV